MVDKSKTDTEKYAGPGKIGSAVGGSAVWGALGVVTTALLSWPLIAAANKGEVVGAETLWKTLRNAKGGNFAIFGAAAGIGLLIYGAIRGWGKARKGEEQFNELKSQRDELNARNDGLQTQVQGLNEEVGVHRKRFSEGLHSRAAHGSHADAAKHEKDHSATAEVGA